MDSGFLLVWVGALLVGAGVLFTAAQAIRRGRLSQARWPTPGNPNDSLEPRGNAAGLGLKVNWPGLVLIGLGFILLLAGSAVD